MTAPKIVSGGLSNMADLNKDEAWLQGWLKEQPTRLGLGEMSVVDGDPIQDDGGNPAFLASDDTRYFSVDVRLGEMDASAGFQLLDNWARNRVRLPDMTHVAVLVTETAGERYRTTLETLAEHLPLVVVELQVWRGESEAILVPHVTLSSEDVDLSDTPAVQAAEAAAAAQAAAAKPAASAVEDVADEPEPQAVVEDADEDTAEPEEAAAPGSKDDTGVADPWGLPPADGDEAESTGSGLLSKIGN